MTIWGVLMRSSFSPLALPLLLAGAALLLHRHVLHHQRQIMISTVSRRDDDLRPRTEIPTDEANRAIALVVCLLFSALLLDAALFASFALLLARAARVPMRKILDPKIRSGIIRSSKIHLIMNAQERRASS